jgi:hypothetical protein
MLPYALPGPPAAHPWAYALVSDLRLPGAVWDLAEGIMALKAHNDTGHLAFLLGELRLRGWWYFYLVDLAVKTPVPLLLTGPAGLVLLWRQGSRERDAWRCAPALLFLGLLGFASGFSRINIGIRHVLILYPFLCLGGAHLIAVLWRRAGTPNPTPSVRILVPALALALVGGQLVKLARDFPDYLASFNLLAPHPERIVIDSDLDWGQDIKRLARALAQRHVRTFSFAYHGTADLQRAGLPDVSLLPPAHPTSGWVAITALTRADEPHGYAWLGRYRPVERIGKTIDLYFIPPPAPYRAN